MAQQQTQNRLRDQLSTLMTGSREECRKAKKEIQSLWHRETKSFQSDAEVALEFLPKFDEIENVVNQEALVTGLGLFFLALADDHFETLKKFTLKIIQHPNGHVREAIRKTAEWLYCSLTSRMSPFMFPDGKKLTDEQKSRQGVAREQYAKYIKDIEALIEKYDTGSNNVEYIDEMKPSIHKSLQQFWFRLTEGYSYQKLLESGRQIRPEILIRRKQIEEQLDAMFKETESKFSLEDVKGAIFYEEGNDDMMKVVAMFDRGGDASELSNVLELVTEAWNYFPHKILNGLSPAEKISS